MTSIQFTRKRAMEKAILTDMAWSMNKTGYTNTDLKETFLEFVREAKANGDPISLTEVLQIVKQEEFDRRMAEAKENYAKEINQIGIDLGYTL